MRSDPAEIISPVFQLILNYLSVEELLTCTMVSHLWQSKVDTPPRWERIFFLFFPNEFRLLKLSQAPVNSWMNQFRREKKLQLRHLSPFIDKIFPYSDATKYRKIRAFEPHQMRLFFYCKEGNTSEIENLCERLTVSDLTLTDYYGFDALYYLAFHRRSDIARILYQNVALKESSRNTPEDFPLLNFAVATQQTEEINGLIKPGANLNQLNCNGRSPLFIACQNGDEDTFSRLLNAGASIMLFDTWGNTPLHSASQNGHANIMRELVRKQPRLVSYTNHSGNSPLYLACRNGHEEVVDILLEADAILDWKSDNGFTPLAIACQNGHVSIIQKLLRKGADPKFLDDSCLKVSISFSYACVQKIPGNLEGITYTDAQKSRDKSALNAAIANGHGAMLISILLKNYLTQLLHSSSSPKNWPLFQAASTLRFFALGQAKKQDLKAHRSIYRGDVQLRKYSELLFKCMESHQENNSAGLPKLLKEYFAAKNGCESTKAEAIEKQVMECCGNEKNSIEPYLVLALIHLNEMGEKNRSKFQAAKLWAFELDPDWIETKIILEKWISQAIISREMTNGFFEPFAPFTHQPN